MTDWSQINEDGIRQIQEWAGVPADGKLGPGTMEAVRQRFFSETAPRGPSPFPPVEIERRGTADAIVELALSQVGTNEHDHPEAVCAYGGASPDVPWCAYFANACLSAAGFPNSGSAQAASFCGYGEPVERHDILPGDILVWPHHVAICVNVPAVEVVSGNMSNAVKRHPCTEGWGVPLSRAIVRRPTLYEPEAA